MDEKELQRFRDRIHLLEKFEQKMNPAQRESLKLIYSLTLDIITANEQ
jgi:hypothetical protein